MMASLRLSILSPFSDMENQHDYKVFSTNFINISNYISYYINKIYRIYLDYFLFEIRYIISYLTILIIKFYFLIAGKEDFFISCN